jgi:hypothetical protein
MSLILSTNHQYQKANDPAGFEPVVINTEREAFDIVGKFDWSASLFRDGHRKVENFMESVNIGVDIDNTTEHQMSIKDFQSTFSGIEYWIFTSRNHQKEKRHRNGVYPPQDRYHAVFPVSESIKNPDEYREFVEALISVYPCIDAGAKDAARFFFGSYDTIVIHNKGKNIEKPVVKPIERPRNITPMLPVNDYQDEGKKKEEIYNLLVSAAHAGAFDDRKDWIDCGMAMKSQNYGFEQWMELSWDTERSNVSENQKRWDGFKGDKHSSGTLVMFARVADPGFMVKKIASVPYSKKNVITPANDAVVMERQNILTMPWERWYQPHVVVTKKKDVVTGLYYDVHKAKSTLENFEAMISFYGITILENLMTRDIEILIPGLEKSEGKSENASHGYILSICVLNEFQVGNLDYFIVTIGHRHSYHPVKDWFGTLEPWDGKDRVQELLDTVLDIQYFEGLEKLPEILLRKWFVSCVAAVMNKSYRGRGVLTFQGEQEIGKTSFFRSIVPQAHFDDWFKDGVHIDTKDKDSVKRVISHWIVELGEIEGMFRKEISALKAFITSDEDILRLPYEPKAEHYPRRTIMCATVNDPNFLNDPTGSSRFWVITAKKINYVHDIDIDQLWAQALYLYTTGTTWYLEGDERKMLSLSNANFYELDTHAELLKLKYEIETIGDPACKLTTMSATEVCIILGLRVERKETRAVATALRSLGVKEGFCVNRSKGFMMPPARLSAFTNTNDNWRDN